MKLKTWMKKNKKTLREVGKGLKVSHTSVWKYCEGLRTPSMVNANKIKKYTKGEVDLSDWVK